MADSISFKMLTGAFDTGIQQRRARMPRAAMFAVREAGRATKRSARSAAPVLKDKTKQSHRQLQKARKQGNDVSGAYKTAVPGLLRASISSSRQIKRVGDVYSIKVGPRGPRVHLYAGKIEARAHYMDAGEAAAVAVLAATAQRAFNKVWAG